MMAISFSFAAVERLLSKYCFRSPPEQCSTTRKMKEEFS
jgi:hypothetical protein